MESILLWSGLVLGGPWYKPSDKGRWGLVWRFGPTSVRAGVQESSSLSPESPTPPQKLLISTPK